MQIPIKIISAQGCPLRMESSYFRQGCAGVQWDNGLATLVFERPEGYEQYNMHLRVQNNIFRKSINLGADNEQPLIRPLTAGPELELEVWFWDGAEFIGQTGAQTLRFSPRMPDDDIYGEKFTPIPHYIPGPPGPQGTGVNILGSYPTYEALVAAHPTGEPGDAYLVQGDLYVWSGTAWDNVGNIQGPAGFKGWTSVVAVVADGERRALRVTDWTGGEGTKPETGMYIGTGGFVADIADAVDVRGGTGATGATGPAGIGINIQEGEYREPGSTKPLPDLPDILTVADGNAYLVDDDDVPGQYDLYIRGESATTWTIVDNWGGVPGQTGDRGPQGNTGPAGYTPQRGTDYWTAADQTAIVADVLAALPNGDEVAY